jgi:hypothetical protein
MLCKHHVYLYSHLPVSFVQEKHLCHPNSENKIYTYIKKIYRTKTNTRWFKYDQDDLCVNKSQFVPVIFEPPCIPRMAELMNASKYLGSSEQHSYKFTLKSTLLK